MPPSSKLATTRNTKKKKQLLKTALRLFARRGYAGVGVRQIAEEAGVSIGLIRMHFGSKGGLRNELDNIVIESIRSLYQGILEHPGDKSLNHLVDDAMQFSKKDLDSLMYLRMALMENSPGARKMTKELLKITQAWIETLAERKMLRSDVDRRSAALFMMFQLIGPLVVEPFSQDLTGASLYTPESVSRRSALLKQALTSGLIKDQHTQQ